MNNHDADDKMDNYIFLNHHMIIHMTNMVKIGFPHLSESLSSEPAILPIHSSTVGMLMKALNRKIEYTQIDKSDNRIYSNQISNIEYTHIDKSD